MIFLFFYLPVEGQWTPFRDPFVLSIGNTAISTGLIGWTADRFVLDSLESTLTDGSDFSRADVYAARYLNIDVSIFRYNWLYPLWAQGIIDVQSGLGFRIWKPLADYKKPSSWPAGGGSATRTRLFPSVLEFNLDHTLTYPLLPFANVYLRGGNGFSKAYLYRNAANEGVLASNSWTWSLGGGIQYFRAGDGNSKLAYGIEVMHNSQAFDFTKSSSSRVADALQQQYNSPIKSVNLSHTTVALTLGFMFGGNTNLAYQGYRAEQRRDYKQAVSQYRDFLSMYPNHHNAKQVRERLAAVRNRLPEQYLHEAIQNFRADKFVETEDLLNLAGESDDAQIQTKVKELRSQLGKTYLRAAQNDLQNFDFEAVEAHIKATRKVTSELDRPSQFLTSKLALAKGVALYQSGLYDRALFWLDSAVAVNPGLRSDAQAYKSKIAQGMVADANKGIQQENRVLIYERLKQAVALDPRLKRILEEPIHDLDVSLTTDKLRGLDAMTEWELGRYLIKTEPGFTKKDIQPQTGMDRLVLDKLAGKPQQVYQNGTSELWIYCFKNGERLQIYLDSGIVNKIVKSSPDEKN